MLSALAGAGLWLAACGGRDVPAEWPQQSAASPDAEAAPVARVTQALEGPPPLPGEEVSGWEGLGATSAAGEHAGHAGARHDASAEAAGNAVRYVCPMHPDVVADQPGTCPRCGMALVKRDAPK
jgi:hypothetical protein